MGTAVIVVPYRGRFAAGWGLQRAMRAGNVSDWREGKLTFLFVKPDQRRVSSASVL